MIYRREIDGLRALALLPVIFSHAGFQTFSGGFVGVDIFFVISGYLITTIIVTELEQGCFSIVHFYERRARRILPALFIVMLVCIPFAWVWLTPGDMNNFAHSLVAVSLFASNFLFWRESGYFDSASELKPLLHTWSLAVEEQYYFLIPLFLLLSWKLGKRWILFLLGLVFIASLGAAHWLVYTNPETAFYLLPTRCWELLIGVFAAFYLSQTKHKDFSKISRELCGWLGVSLILYSVFSYSNVTPFPSLYTLVPTLGALLIIVFATQETLVGRFIGNKVFVGIGMLSYSAYLWHQPLFSFARHKSLVEPSKSVFLLLSIITLVLAYFSLHFVEAPLRDKKHFNQKIVFTLFLFGAVFFLSMGIILSKTSLQYYRFDREQLNIFSDRDNNKAYMKNKAFNRFTCFFDQSQRVSVVFESDCVFPTSAKRIIIFGDSEAAHYFHGFKFIFEKNYEIMQFTGASCRAFDFNGNSQRCREFYSAFIDKIVPTLSSKDTIIVASNWWNTYHSIGEDAFEKGLIHILSLLKNSSAKIVLIGNTPDFIRDPYELLAMNLEHEGYFFPVKNYRDSDRLLERLARDFDVIYFSPASHICSGDNCKFRDDTDYLFFDSGHLSSYGSEMIVKIFQQQFESHIRY